MGFISLFLETLPSVTESLDKLSVLLCGNVRNWGTLELHATPKESRVEMVFFLYPFRLIGEQLNNQVGSGSGRTAQPNIAMRRSHDV